MERATAQAPATIANVCVGFDILGFAVPIMSDKVSVRRISKGVNIREVQGQELPLDPYKNTAGLGLMKMIEDLNLDFGFEIEIKKGIPLGSGLGGSAASAVASVVAANSLLESPLKKEDLFKFALHGESAASGGNLHGDNVAASLFGGLTMCLRNGKSAEGFQAVRLPIPDVICVIVKPNMAIETKAAREILSDSVSLTGHVQQSMGLAAFLHAIYSNDLNLLKGYFEDILIEPQRAHLIPRFQEIKSSAMKNGAIGFSIAGAGPTMFGWFLDSEEANKAEQAFKEMGLNTWRCKISENGAKTHQIE